MDWWNDVKADGWIDGIMKKLMDGLMESCKG